MTQRRSTWPRVVAVGAGVFFGFFAAPASALAQGVFELVQIADGIYGSFVREPTSPSQYAASLIVVNDDHVLVVDSRQTPAAARALIDDIRSLTNRPVRYLVNTHWHGDHVYGNEEFRRAYPEVRIVGHPRTVESMRTAGADRLADEIATTHEQVQTSLGWLDAGRTDEGRVLSSEDSLEVQAAVEQALDHSLQLEGMSLVVPDLLVRGSTAPDFPEADALVIRSGERSIRVFHPGAAHTYGDLVVEILPEGVLAVGDLIEDGFPYLEDGTVVGVSEALTRLAAVPAEVVFGSHARLLSDRTLMDLQTRFFQELVDQVDRSVADGRSVEETVGTVRMQGFRESFTADVPSRAEGYAAFVEGLVRQAYAERRPEV